MSVASEGSSRSSQSSLLDGSKIPPYNLIEGIQGYVRGKGSGHIPALIGKGSKILQEFFGVKGLGKVISGASHVGGFLSPLTVVADITDVLQEKDSVKKTQAFFEAAGDTYAGVKFYSSHLELFSLPSWFETLGLGALVCAGVANVIELYVGSSEYQDACEKLKGAKLLSVLEKQNVEEKKTAAILKIIKAVFKVAAGALALYALFVGVASLFAGAILVISVAGTFFSVVEHFYKDSMIDKRLKRSVADAAEKRPFEERLAEVAKPQVVSNALKSRLLAVVA